MFGKNKKEKRSEEPKKEKVPFKDRKIVVWAKENAPELLGNSLEFIGDVTGIEVVEKLGEKISGSKELTPEQKQQALEVYKLDLESYKAENEDRASARIREVEIAKTGKKDWMMALTGIIGLACFVLMVISAIFVPSMQANPLAHQIMGIIEGVSLSIFYYYFGSSKGSSEKTKIMSDKF